MRKGFARALVTARSSLNTTCKSELEGVDSCTARLSQERAISGSFATTSQNLAVPGNWGSFGILLRKFSTAQEGANANISEASPLLSTPAPDGSNPATSGPYAEQIYGKTPSVYGIGRAGAKLRDISMSEKKLNYFAKLIRRMHVEDALAQCKLQPKKAGSICAKAINSAMANAENNHGLDRSKLMIDIINLGRGKKRYELWAKAKGRATKRNHALSHMEVILKESDQRPRMKYRKPLLERLKSRGTDKQGSSSQSRNLDQRKPLPARAARAP